MLFVAGAVIEAPHGHGLKECLLALNQYLFSAWKITGYFRVKKKNRRLSKRVRSPGRSEWRGEGCQGMRSSAGLCRRIRTTKSSQKVSRWSSVGLHERGLPKSLSPGGPQSIPLQRD